MLIKSYRIKEVTNVGETFITEVCKDKLEQNMRINETMLERIERKTEEENKQRSKAAKRSIYRVQAVEKLTILERKIPELGIY